MVTTCGLANDTPISISLNFDSLNEAARFPKGFIDPSFFKGFDRISDLLAKRNLKATILIIGRDLVNPEIRDRVADWGKAGFEIGNHSYSHHCNLGALPPKILSLAPAGLILDISHLGILPAYNKLISSLYADAHPILLSATTTVVSVL